MGARNIAVLGGGSAGGGWCGRATAAAIAIAITTTQASDVPPASSCPETRRAKRPGVRSSIPAGGPIGRTASSVVVRFPNFSNR